MKVVSLLTFTVVWLGLSSALQADEIRYQWQGVPNATYYQGTIQQGGDKVHFRTTSMWLMLQEGAIVTLESFGSDAEVIGPVKIQAGVPLARPPVAPREPTPQPVPESTPEPAPKEEEAAPEPKEEAAPEPKEEAAAPTEVIQPAVALVGLHLGIGKEWLVAKGGISDYSGSTNVGGTELTAVYRPRSSSWYFDGSVKAHNYTTVTKEQAADGSISESESKFLRLAVRAAAFYDFNGGDTHPSYSAGLGLGLAYFRVPTLAIKDKVTGAAALANHAGLGPYIGLGYERYLDEAHTLGFDLEYLPLTLSGGGKGTGTKAFTFWRYAFVRDLYTEVGLVSERDTLSLTVDCPSVTNCSDTSKTTANLIQALMGIGYRW